MPNWPTTEGAGYVLDDRLTTPATSPKDPWNIDLARSFRAFKGKGMEHVMAELHRHLAALLSAPSDLAPVIDKQVTTSIREVWTPTAENFFSRVGGPYLTRTIAKLLRRRSAIEPMIGHMKNDGRLTRSPLKGTAGDAIFAVLCGCGHNIRMILRHLRVPLRHIFWLIISLCMIIVVKVAPNHPNQIGKLAA